jgi:putative PIN family toxin of toxin-antitoxin system
MRVVLDTNVLISGICFGGQPGKILQAWRTNQIQMVISPEILEEYLEVAQRLATRYVGIEYERILNLIVQNSELVQPGDLPEPVCDDADDDKFSKMRSEHSKR